MNLRVNGSRQLFTKFLDLSRQICHSLRTPDTGTSVLDDSGVIGLISFLAVGDFD
jgi:hypothetical protein